MRSADIITIELGGCWNGRYGSAPCPVCQPERRREQNALTLSDGYKGLLAHCKKSGCSFRDIAAAAGVGPDSAGGLAYARPDPVETAKRRAKAQAEEIKRSAQAQRVWDEALPIANTTAETYLRGRGITCALPSTLRYHPEAWHGATAQRLPAMVALAEGSTGFAVHRTYLLPDGSGKALVEPAKAMLGSVTGGAVRLSEAHGPIVVAEGIETALSLTSGLIGGPVTAWAALSTSGIRGLKLPPTQGRITVAPDGDAAGHAAATALAERAHALGWSVSLLPAPKGYDWNDVLTGKGGAA